MRTESFLSLLDDGAVARTSPPLLVAELDGAAVGIDLACVSSILMPQRQLRLESPMAGLSGVIALRGRRVPVLDPYDLLCVDTEQDFAGKRFSRASRMVALKARGVLAILPVDAIHAIAALAPPAALGGSVPCQQRFARLLQSGCVTGFTACRAADASSSGLVTVAVVDAALLLAACLPSGALDALRLLQGRVRPATLRTAALSGQWRRQRSGRRAA